MRGRAHPMTTPHITIANDDHIAGPALSARHRVEDEHRLPPGDVRHEHQPEGPAVEDLHAGVRRRRQAPGRGHSHAVVAQQLVADAQDQDGRPRPGHSRSFGRNLKPEKIEEITPVPSTRSTSIALYRWWIMNPQVSHMIR